MATPDRKDSTRRNSLAVAWHRLYHDDSLLRVGSGVGHHLVTFDLSSHCRPGVDVGRSEAVADMLARNITGG